MSVFRDWRQDGRKLTPVWIFAVTGGQLPTVASGAMSATAATSLCVQWQLSGEVSGLANDRKWPRDALGDRQVSTHSRQQFPR